MILVNGVIVKQEVKLVDILEPFILGLYTLGKLRAKLDTITRQLQVSTQAAQENKGGPTKGVNSEWYIIYKIS